MGTPLTPQENVIRGHRLHPEAAKRPGAKPLYPTPKTPAARATELVNELIRSEPQVLRPLLQALATRLKVPLPGVNGLAASNPATETDDLPSNRPQTYRPRPEGAPRLS